MRCVKMFRSTTTALALVATSLLFSGDEGLVAARAGEPSLVLADVEFFEAKIRPVLVENCYTCHSSDAETLQGGLLLDSRDGLLAGGDSGPAVIPGKPDESLLLDAINYESFEMPPKGRLPAAVIADFAQWVAMGAPDPRVGPAPAPRAGVDIEAGRKFWCFQPVEQPAPPPIRKFDWARCAVDHFVLARLEQERIHPAPDADRATWLRRVSFDLIGLPPTLQESDDFLADESPDAFARVVDRLLASPHFGERWGRHWLDVARFAESSGGGRSMVFKDAWRYRDYVINSINGDKPVDQFIVEQLAGDLLPHTSDDQRREHLVATAYLLLGPHNYEEQDKHALELDVVDEQLETIGRGLLGMTVACARCHDHKFDPIPTEDYYALAGILRSTHTLVHANVSTWATQPLPMSEAESNAVRAHQARMEKMARRHKEVKRDGDEKLAAALFAKLANLKARNPQPTAMAVKDAAAIEDCRICIRGSVHHRGSPAPRGVLQVATTGQRPAMPAHESGRRELAQWIVAAENPLTARVYVNRVWHYLFGAGLVRTVDNFGSTGELPSHPELLDYLASRFVEDGWSTKRLVRELALSHAYRMSAASDAAAAAIDPENRLLWRMNRRRLDAESLRDAMLAVSGNLDLQIGGPNIRDEKVLAEAGTPTPAEYDYAFVDARRSVYTPAFRNRMHELFEVFDMADQNRPVGQRTATTTAPQALLMLNSQFVMEQAAAAAARALDDGEANDQQRIERAFRETLGRAPTAGELAIALRTVGRESTSVGAAPREAWEQLFQGLFGCVAFRYLD